MWMSLCHYLFSESVFVRNWHNELSVREASGGEALLQAVLVDPLLTSVEVGLVLSTASLLDSTSATFPVSHFFKRTTHNEEPLNGVAACLTPRRLKFAVSSRRRESQHLPQPQLRAPKLHLQSSAPASQQQLDQDQRVQTGRFSCGVLFSCFSCS